jgi:hypothetical protein
MQTLLGQMAVVLPVAPDFDAMERTLLHAPLQQKLSRLHCNRGAGFPATAPYNNLS